MHGSLTPPTTNCSVASIFITQQFIQHESVEKGNLVQVEYSIWLMWSGENNACGTGFSLIFSFFLFLSAAPEINGKKSNFSIIANIPWGLPFVTFCGGIAS